MEAKIGKHNGKTAIFIDGKPCTSTIAMIRTRDIVDGKRELFFNKQYFRELGKSGIKIYLITCNTPWTQPDALEIFDKEAQMLFDAVPDAYIIARFGLHPPKQWVEENPDECVLYSDGSTNPVHLFTETYETDYPAFYSLASAKWREEATKYLTDTWKKVMKLPYADRIIGCMPTAGGTSEWYSMGPFLDHDQKRCKGYSKAFRKAFSEYLRQVYGTDENLQKHWNHPQATIDNPPIPGYEQHYFSDNVDTDVAIPRQKMLSNAEVPPAYSNGTNVGSFPDFSTNMAVYDFYRAWHLATAKAQIHFAKSIKEITPDRLVGMCYGSQNNAAVMGSGTNGGTRLILESPYIDFLENPSVYENRQPGGFSGQRVVQDTFSLHNKIYICQDDSRTLAENRFFKNKYGIYDIKDTLNVLKREFGKCICEDMHRWWFDQLLGGKRYKHPEIYELFARQSEITAESYTLDRNKNSEIVCIFDEETIQSVSMQTTRDLIARLRHYELARVGAPIDQYYHNDMGNPEMPSYKLYIFVNVFILSEEERKVIQAKLRKDKAVAVWLYAPGFIEPMAENKMSIDHMRELTGIDINMINDSFDAVFRWDGEHHALCNGLDRRELFGNFKQKTINNMVPQHYKWTYDTYLYPLFYPVDPQAQVLAHFASTGYPAVAVKECDGYVSVFYGSKSISYKEIRAFAQYAGVHVFSCSGDVTYVGRNYITFHASTGGKKTLHLPQKADVYEVYEKKWYGKGVDVFEFEMYTGETKMFRYQ